YTELIIVSLIVFTYIRSKIDRLINKLVIVISASKTVLIVVVWYFYLLSFNIVYFILPQLPLNTCWFITPWFVYPMQLGVTGIMALINITSSRDNLTTREKYLIMLIALLFIFGKMLNLVNANLFFTGYYESRIIYMMFIPTSIITAQGINKIFLKINHSETKFLQRKIIKQFIIVFLLGIIIISGIFSTLFSIEFWRVANDPWGERSEEITPGEMEGLNFISSNAQQTITVLTTVRLMGSISDEEVRLIGVNVFPHMFQLSPFIAERPETIFYFQNALNLKYIFISSRDTDILSQYNRSYLINHLLKHLPIVFKNDDVTIYKVPSFYPPSNSDFAVVLPYNFVSDVIFYSLEMVALSKLRYETYINEDYAQFKSKIILLSYDPMEEELNNEELINATTYVTNYIKWVTRGGTLMVLNTHGFGIFSNMLSIKNLSVAEKADAIKNNDRLLPVPSLLVFKTCSTDPTVRVIANYIYNGSIVSPFIYAKKYGNGKIIVVDILPLYTALLSMEEESRRWELFDKIKYILDLTNLQVQTYRYASNNYAYVVPLIAMGYIEATGSVKIRGESILFQKSFSVWILAIQIYRFHIYKV
ncbi:MAG: hypothetical protein J7L07_05850, partial [Candidatus Odinarchaeota archaeon]|nr:hypothetical protein [Candidatus Odinarchaeota archaeon]